MARYPLAKANGNELEKPNHRRSFQGTNYLLRIGFSLTRVVG
jgi:hypothetical protein